MLIYAFVTAGLLVLGETGLRRMLRGRVSQARVDRAFDEVREGTACEREALAKGESPPANCPAAGVRRVVARTVKKLKRQKKRWVRALDVVNTLGYPTRLTQGPKGRLYVSDAKVGSVFILDSELQVVGELKGLARPLGVAVSRRGRIYVGNDGRNNVEIYDARGRKVGTVDDGGIEMPNDLVLDRAGRLYVADSLSNLVRVYGRRGLPLWTVGAASNGFDGLRFPAAVAIGYGVDTGGQKVGELYVADQGNGRVVVFDLEGNYLRDYGFPLGAFSGATQGGFAKLQSLALDDQGRLHAADSYLNKVQILNATTGEFLDSYGGFGTAAGQLNLPLDVWIMRGGVAVANAENGRVDIIEPPL